jgi:hypothetical protein
MMALWAETFAGPAEFGNFADAGTRGSPLRVISVYRHSAECPLPTPCGDIADRAAYRCPRLEADTTFGANRPRYADSGIP